MKAWAADRQGAVFGVYLVKCFKCKIFDRVSLKSFYLQ
jgi:hypothetical protein